MMSKLAARGTKRWCQSEACARPFYDLNRTAYACPTCGAAYVPVPVRAVPALGSPQAARLARSFPAVMPKRAPVVEEVEAAEVAHVEVEVEAEADVGDTEDIFLENDEDDAAITPPTRGEGNAGD